MWRGIRETRINASPHWQDTWWAPCLSGSRVLLGDILGNAHVSFTNSRILPSAGHLLLRMFKVSFLFTLGTSVCRNVLLNQTKKTWFPTLVLRFICCCIGHVCKDAPVMLLCTTHTISIGHRWALGQRRDGVGRDFEREVWRSPCYWSSAEDWFPGILVFRKPPPES